MLKRLLILMCMLLWPIAAAQAFQADIYVHGLSKVTDLQAGETHNVALLSDGTAVSWGGNGDNQRFLGTLSNVAAVGAGDFHTIVAYQNGTVAVFGNWGPTAQTPAAGDVSIPATVPANIATAITAGGGAKQVTGGANFDLALLNDGTVVAWGNGNVYGQTTVPDFGGHAATAIAAGHYYALALLDNGDVVAWGLTIGPMPAEIQGKTIAISARAYHALALTNADDGNKVWAWGSNGDGESTVPAEAASGVSAIAAGGHHSLAIKNGQVIAWGAGTVGQSTVPPNLLPATKLMAGAYFSMAVLGNDDVVGWGDNNASQLKVPTTVYAAPVNGTVTCTPVDTTMPPAPGVTSTCTITPDNLYNLSLFTKNGVNVAGNVVAGGTPGTFTYTFAPSANLYDSITAQFGLADQVAPTVTDFSIPPASTSLTIPITTFTATDNEGGTGVTGYLITESSSTPALDDANWSATAPATFTVTSGGSKTLYAWAKDGANLISASRSATTYIDAQAPTVTAFSSPTLAFFALLKVPFSLTVPVFLTATDDVGVTGYMITTTATPPAVDDFRWSSTPPGSVSVNLATTANLYGWAKDAAGNVSQPFVFGVGGTGTGADTIKPMVVTFTAPAVTNSVTIPISAFIASDNVGVTGYMITTSATAPAAGDGGWSATAPTTFISAGTGSVTLYAWAKDAAGNVSFPVNATVNIDTITPSVGTFTIPLTSDTLTVPITSFTASDSGGVAGYMVTTTNTPPLATDSRWTATPPTSYTFTTAGVKTLYGWVKDNAGNVTGTNPATTTIDLNDSTAPSVLSFQAPTFSFISFFTSLNSGVITLPITSFTATDNKGVTGYKITQGTIPNADDAGWSATPPTAFGMNLAGPHVLWAFVRDAAGNVSAPYMIGTLPPPPPPQ